MGKAEAEGGNAASAGATVAPYTDLLAAYGLAEARARYLDRSLPRGLAAYADTTPDLAELMKAAGEDGLLHSLLPDAGANGGAVGQAKAARGQHDHLPPPLRVTTPTNDQRRSALKFESGAKLSVQPQPAVVDVGGSGSGSKRKKKKKHKSAKKSKRQRT